MRESVLGGPAIILIEPQLGENIGTCARAMLNCGLTDLRLVRPRDGVLLMHTMLWPDELRDGQFAAPPAEVSVSDAEVTMAQSFISALSGDFHPEEYTDAYREALEQVVQSKAAGVPMVEEPEAPREAEVVDLVAALRASVEAAKKRRAEAAVSATG